MKYRVTHTTKYNYEKHVSLCHNVAHLLPRNTGNQKCELSELNIEPLPRTTDEWSDIFGNRQVCFSIEKPHDELIVTAVSNVEVTDANSLLENAFPMTWEDTVEHVRRNDNEECVEARMFLFESEYIQFDQNIYDFGEASFKPRRPLIETVEDLMNRIYKEFEYDAHFSSVATPIEEVMEHRKGVCQDFAHVAIACLRMRGIAARYVSGYIETIPPEGKERLVGADASHAWFSIYVPHLGWLDFDPTNAKIPDEQHITVAWGRDYSDVAPLKGVIYGGGGKSKLNVSVDVQRLEG